MADVERSWSTYRPSKTLWAWSVVAGAILTMFVGFMWGGWVTTGRAIVMRDIAVRDAKAELVAGICVHNFVTSIGAADNLKALKAKSSWQRDDFINEGGWTKIAGLDNTVAKAADACAEQLMKLKELPKAPDAVVTDS